MIVLRNYQTEAVEQLIKKLFLELDAPGRRNKIIFKAPTGAGKTVMTAAFLGEIHKHLVVHPTLNDRRLAYIWIAPNQLHVQSLHAMKAYFETSRKIRPLTYEDVTDRTLREGDMVMVNWQSINKDGNVMVRGGEQGRSIFALVDDTKNAGIDIVLLLDEAHLMAANGARAQEVLAKMDAKVEIDISATPVLNASSRVEVDRRDVVREQMIKKQVVLNPGLKDVAQDSRELDLVLLDEALKQRDLLLEQYKILGKDINPLLLIQLPSEKKALSAEDNTVRERAVAHLATKDITETNGRLAVWLSVEKSNLDEISRNGSPVEVLLFKQAIALGWDCPRAAILVIFRKLEKTEFTIQTVGRILRMPEQQHYANDVLNYGYVYTNLSKEMISIVRDDMDYLVEERALRIPEYEEISQGVMPLQTNFYKTRLEEKRNRIGSDFYKVLVQLAKETYALKTNMDGADWLEHNQKEFEARGVQMNVSELEISVLVDAKIRSEALTDEGEELLKGESDRHFVRTTAELQRQFKQFCLQESGDYARIDSYQRIENALCRFMEDFFKLTDYATYKVVLYGYNQPFWVEFLRIAREAYRAYKNQKAASKSPVILSNDWHVPIQKLYRPDVFKPYPNDEKAVLKPAMISVRQNGKFGESEPEERFLEFLEIPQNRKQIAWWYKNGVGDMSNFCVPYQRYNKTYANFYPDFIIQLNNKTMMVLDTKTPFSDLDTPNKHNRLADWARARSDMGKPTLGSIILFENGTWRFFKGMMDSESQKKPAEWPVLRLEDWGG